MPLSLLALPIARRGSGSSSSDFGAEGPIFCGSGSSTSASDQGGGKTRSSWLTHTASLTVKNTFFELASLSGDEQPEGEPRGAQTCRARLLEPQGLTAFAAGDDADHSGSDGTSSGTCFCESTPWGDSPVARAAARLPGPPAESAQQGAEVVLQVPLRVQSGHPLARGASSGFEFDVTHEGGQTIIRLRVGAGQPGDVALASPPAVAPARSTVAGQGLQASSPRTSKDGGAPAPPRRASAAAAGARPAGEKGLVVCRHWKNKGWCKFQDTCKFQHPDHKRGVGLLAAAGATAAPAQQQPAVLGPAAQPGARKAGRRFHPAVGVAPAFPRTPPPAFSPGLPAPLSTGHAVAFVPRVGVAAAAASVFR